MRKWVFIAVAILALVGAVLFSLLWGSADNNTPEKAFVKMSEVAASIPTYEQQARQVDMIVQTRIKFSDSYSQLQEAAKSNPYAAFQLYQDTSRCANINVRREVLENHAAMNGDPATISNILNQLLEDENLCTSITDAQLALKNDWVIKAARMGHVEAQLIFFGAVTESFDTPEKIVENAEKISEYKAEALQHLRSAAMTGNDTALYNLAMAYQEGTLAKHNAVVAYGYMLALGSKGTTQSAAYYLNLWAQDMSLEQIRAAENFSQQFRR